MRILTIVFIFISVFSCKKIFDAGEIIEELRELDTITEIEVHDMFRIKIHYDSISRMTVKCGEKLMPQITSEQIEGKLILKNENSGSFRRNNPDINIDIYTNTLEKVHLYGVVYLTSDDTLKYNSLKVYAETEIATINLIVDVSFLNLEAYHCTGIYSFSGKADRFIVNNYGTGKLDAFNLFVNDAEIKNYSFGDCSVNVSDTLRYSIYGFGNINYKGNPYIYHGETPSTGKLIKIDK